MIKRFIIAFAGFVTVVALLGVVKASQIQEMASMDRSMPLTAVTTTTARSAEWNPTIKAIGSLAPVQGVTISAELEGTVMEIAVDNGATVAAGDLLIRLDTQVEEAQLDAAKARRDLAKLQADRALSQSLADVAAIEANIAKRTIRAPFDGRVGIRQVNLGQYVSRGTPLIPLQKLDPVFVNFYVPQRSLPLIGIDQSVDVTVDAFPNTVFEAKVSAINPQVDSDTRSVWVQAVLPNPGEKLRSGMFARVEVTLPQINNVVVVPSTSIAYASYGNSIYVIEETETAQGRTSLIARQQPVELGAKRGDMVAVTKGLNGGETVATAGVFKLRNGLPVQINNEVTPSQSETPQPPNT